MAARLLLRGAVITACTLALAPTANAAAAASLGAPAQRVAAVGHTSVTVTAPAAHATSYRLFVSANRTHVYVDNIAKARRTSATRSSRITMSGLSYTTNVYWYRVAAYSGSKHRYSSTIGSFALRPSAPTKLTLTSSGTRFSLSWSASGATGYQVEQYDADRKSGRTVYTQRSNTKQLTPYGLTRGRAYYFRVRSLNHSTGSAWTALVGGTVTTSEQSLKVMSYNLLEGRFAGTKQGGNTVASWTARRAKVVALVKEGAPDVLTVQEGSTFVSGKTRQVDDLNRLLTSYSLARTEIPPTEPGWRRYGVYVLYRTAAFSPVGSGGRFDTGGGNYAAYQLLRSRSTGALIVAVSPHLPRGSAGRAGDEEHQRATTRLVDQGSAYAARHKASVVYAGDFNSNASPTHVFDGSGRAMQAVRHADAITAAQATNNARYNSANQYLRTPPAQGDSIDHIYAPPGVGVRTYAVLLHLSHGRFVGTIPSDHNPIIARISIRY